MRRPRPSGKTGTASAGSDGWSRWLRIGRPQGRAYLNFGTRGGVHPLVRRIRVALRLAVRAACLWPQPEVLTGSYALELPDLDLPMLYQGGGQVPLGEGGAGAWPRRHRGAGMLGGRYRAADPAARPRAARRAASDDAVDGAVAARGGLVGPGQHPGDDRRHPAGLVPHLCVLVQPGPRYPWAVRLVPPGRRDRAATRSGVSAAGGVAWRAGSPTVRPSCARSLPRSGCSNQPTTLAGSAACSAYGPAPRRGTPTPRGTATVTASFDDAPSARRRPRHRQERGWRGRNTGQDRPARW